MMLEVRVGGVVFESHPDDYDHSYLIEPGGVQGWDDGVDVRGTQDARPNADGDFDAPEYLASRVITINGNAIARSPHDLRNMRHQLVGLLPARKLETLTVQTDEGSLWTRVRRAGKTRFETAGATGTEAEFEVSFWAPLPFKYGPVNTYPGPTAQVFHRGNVRAWPIIEVTGTLPSGYTVGSQGKLYTVAQALTAGQTHRIDMATGWLYRNGVLQTGAVYAAETFTIPPGPGVPVVFTPTSGSGSMTVRVTDTFV